MKGLVVLDRGGVINRDSDDFIKSAEVLRDFSAAALLREASLAESTQDRSR